VYTYAAGETVQFTAPSTGLQDKLAGKVSEELKQFATKKADVPKPHAEKFENVVLNKNVAQQPVEGKKDRKQVTVTFD